MFLNQVNSMFCRNTISPELMIRKGLKKNLEIFQKSIHMFPTDVTVSMGRNACFKSIAYLLTIWKKNPAQIFAVIQKIQLFLPPKKIPKDLAKNREGETQ